MAEQLGDGVTAPHELDDEGVEDDRLRLIFTCCHPALPPDAQIALTLREVCGLTTEEIARAFLSPAPTLAQRIVRAKAKIRDARRFPIRCPRGPTCPSGSTTVLHVIYLVFNEGYSASSGASLTRHDLSAEAIRLGRLLVELLPEPEAVGPARADAAARVAARGAHVGRRASWCCWTIRTARAGTGTQIAEGVALVERALRSRRFGPYTLQAAIAAVHAEAPSAAETDWAEIVGLYDVLLRADPSPVVELNRAAAVAMRDGPAGRAGADRRHPGPRRAGRLSTSRTRRGRTCAAGWAERPRRSSPTSGRSSSPGRSRSGGFSSGGSASCRRIKRRVAFSSPDL